MGVLTFFLVAFCIEHLTDILVNVDVLEGKRQEFELMYPSLAKLARCRFCQSFWLSGAVCMFAPALLKIGGDPFSVLLELGISWLVLHKTVVLMIEATDRFLGRAPKSHNVVLHVADDGSGE